MSYCKKHDEVFGVYCSGCAAEQNTQPSIAPLPVQEQGGKIDDWQFNEWVEVFKAYSQINQGLKSEADIWSDLSKKYRLVLKEVSPPASQPSYEVEKKIVLEGTYFVGECGGCGFKASSGEWEGCHPIADTGDYGDPICPICGSKDLEEADNDIYVDQRDMLIAKIKELRDLYENLYWENHMRSYNAGHSTPPDKEDKPVPEEIMQWIEKRTPVYDVGCEDTLLDAFEEGAILMYRHMQEEKRIANMIASGGTVNPPMENLIKSFQSELSSIKTERDEALAEVKEADETCRDVLAGNYITNYRKLREEANEYRKALERISEGLPAEGRSQIRRALSLDHQETATIILNKYPKTKD